MLRMRLLCYSEVKQGAVLIAHRDFEDASAETAPNIADHLSVVKEPWGAAKTFLDVVSTLLLLCQGEKV